MLDLKGHRCSCRRANSQSASHQYSFQQHVQDYQLSGLQLGRRAQRD